MAKSTDLVQILDKPVKESKDSKPRHDSVRINEPGIVCWEPGDSGGVPVPAMVIRPYGRRTLELLTFSNSGMKYVSGARHKDDPDLKDNHELQAVTYTWGFNDEYTPNKG